MERLPRAVCSLSDVEDDGVGVQLGIKSAARVVVEARDQKVVGGFDAKDAAAPGSRACSVLLNIAKGHVDGLRVREQDPIIIGDQSSEAHALRSAERQVDAGSVGFRCRLWR